MQAQGGVYGLPMDSGPMALFYNKEVFDKHGIAVPTTWDEYLEAGTRAAQGRPEGLHHQRHRRRRLHHQPDLAGRRQALQGGRHQRRRSNFSDAGLHQVRRRPGRSSSTRSCSRPSARWSDEWYKGLGDGTIATLSTGAWMPGNLVSGVADGGRQMAGRPAAAVGAGANGQRRERRQLAGHARGRQQQGSSAYALPRSTPTSSEGVQTRIDGGRVPRHHSGPRSPRRS